MRVAGLIGLGLFALTNSSFAADLPILRGSVGPVLGYQSYYRWEGFYLGGHGGWSSGGADFGNATKSLVAYLLRNTDVEEENQVSSWTTLPKRDTSGTNFGGFVGYNFQWDDAVLGIEASYSKTKLSFAASDGMTRTFSTSVARHTLTVDAAAGLEITDLASVRGRAGWAFGAVLPYITGGLAVGRGNVTKYAHVNDDWCDITVDSACTPVPHFESATSDNKSGYFAYGYSFGAGVDWAVLPNLFLRAEYEYLGFSDFSDMKVNVNNVRAGAGLKF